ncbi:MAG: ABC transporter ATP-binding protein [Candidatus Micrarchaeia archaeon]
MHSILCKKISKTYPNGKKALNNLSFSFKGKGILSIIGKNGAGKTTLIRILATELVPTSGTAFIDNIDIIKNPEQIREKIAIIPQEARAVQWLTPKQTLISYLMYRGFSYSQSKKLAMESLKKLSLSKNLNTLNRLLSGGTKRKVLVSYVLSSGAKIIFLDEPTTGLDPISRSELWNLLKKLKDDYLIVLTTHYLEEAERLADKIILIDEGKLIAYDIMEGLRKKIKYNYSILISGDVKKLPKFTNVKYKIIKGLNNGYQILTNVKDSKTITNVLIKDKIKFSINPVSLEDIFYYLVKKTISEDSDKSDNNEY